MSEIDQMQIAAEHEAAHAVMYIVFGYTVHVCEIQDGLGFTSSPPGTLLDIWHNAVIHAAGPVIEDGYVSIPLRERWESAQDPEVGGDFAGVPWGFVETAFDVAAALLADNDELHTRITSALLLRGSLDADDINALIS